MELALTAVIKAVILHKRRGCSSGDKQLKTQQKSSKLKMCQLPLPLGSGDWRQSPLPTTVLLRTTLTRMIKLHYYMLPPGSNHLL